MRRTALGFLAGAALTYFADPVRGRRRRAIVRDKFTSALRDTGNLLDKACRDSWNRTQGVAASAVSICKRDDADDTVVVERVRSAIGHAVSHPHAIKVYAGGNGQIILEGPVLRHELDYLLKRVESVRGVREVVNRLAVYAEPEGVSSLQGGVNRRAMSEFAQERWNPSLRVASAIAAGAALYSGFRNDGPLGWLGGIGGAALLTRAVVNKPFRQIVGIDRCEVNFEKTTHIHAPVEEVYAYWSNFENFPKFMAHLKEVRPLQNGRSHWVAAGPGGVSIPWDAEITEHRENQVLAWTSVPGSLVRTAGRVRFDKDPDGSTRVTIRMSYCPPAGVFGHAVACLFGADPKSEIDDDLVRMRSLLEVGKTRAHGHPVTREQVPVAPAGQQPQQAW